MSLRSTPDGLQTGVDLGCGSGMVRFGKGATYEYVSTSLILTIVCWHVKYNRVVRSSFCVQSGGIAILDSQPESCTLSIE